MENNSPPATEASGIVEDIGRCKFALAVLMCCEMLLDQIADLQSRWPRAP